MNREHRLECLRLAAEKGGHVEDIVKHAEAFWAFVYSKDPSGANRELLQGTPQTCPEAISDPPDSASRS